jgi:hypothetical protein
MFEPIYVSFFILCLYSSKIKQNKISQYDKNVFDKLFKTIKLHKHLLFHFKI